jgi:hypothetical protein
MLIKEDNTPCISCIEASVDLQHGEIICLTDASVKWLQRHKDNIVSKRAICMKEDDEKGYIIAYPGHRLLEAKNRYVFTKQ